MKVLLINTSDKTGGAARACNRLFRALLNAGVDAKFLVKDKSSDAVDIQSITKYSFSRLKSKSKFIFERLTIYPSLKNKRDLFFFSPANTGFNISNHPLVQEADVIHLHWINQGFLSLNDIQKLIELKKQIVWTLHDMWAFTGGCHYSRGCLNFQNKCGKCPILNGRNEHDLSNKTWNKKNSIFSQKNNLSFVTCSNWLSGIAMQSSLLKNHPVYSVPNPIDIDFFKPIPKKEARDYFKLDEDKFYILFGALNMEDERKGFKYFSDALKLIADKEPGSLKKIELIVFGKSKQEHSNTFGFKVNYLGFITSPELLNAAYNAASIFVLPSLEDNLPNTIMESLSCGVPVVAFNIGGIPEMIEHGKNGILVEPQSSNDLAEGILKIFNGEINYEMLSKNAREKVLNEFTNEKVAEQYIDIYKRALTTCQ